MMKYARHCTSISHPHPRRALRCWEESNINIFAKDLEVSPEARQLNEIHLHDRCEDPSELVAEYPDRAISEDSVLQHASPSTPCLSSKN